MTRNYIKNLETGKVELHFTKPEFQALPTTLRADLKRHYLWSPKADAWVSRSINNQWQAIEVAKKLGFTEEERQGERLTYAEQLERKAEKAENRAERYEKYADNATNRGKAMQSELDSHRGDIAFFTQPIIRGHSGSESFANRRNKIFDRYFKGFEEYKKSDYFRKKVENARKTANMTQLQNPVYVNNRIEECKANIRAFERTLNKSLEVQTAETLKWQEDMLHKLEYEIDKLGFFEACMGDLQKHIQNTGGVVYTKNDIKIGYLVQSYKHRSWARVTKVNPKTISAKYIEPHLAGLELLCAYPEIKEVVIPNDWCEEKPDNPFKLGDIVYYSDISGRSILRAYQVVKLTDKTISIKRIDVVNNAPVLNCFVSNDIERKTVKRDRNGTPVVNYRDWYMYKYN